MNPDLVIPTAPNLHQRTDLWLCGQRPLSVQRGDRYIDERTVYPDDVPWEKRKPHPARFWPDEAGAIIDTYSRLGDRCLEFMAGTGTGIIEGMERGRYVAGVELVPLWARAAEANIALAEGRGAPGIGSVIQGDARHLPDLLPGMIGQFDLVFGSPPYLVRQDGGPNRGGALGNYTGEDRLLGSRRRDPTNIGNLSHDHMAYAAAMRQVYQGCYLLARPGAYLVSVVKDSRKDHKHISLVGITRQIMQEAGWRIYDEATIVLAGVEADRLIDRPSWQQRTNAKNNHHLLYVTEKVLVAVKVV